MGSLWNPWNPVPPFSSHGGEILMENTLFCRQVTGVMNAIQGMFSALDRANLSLNSAM